MSVLDHQRPTWLWACGFVAGIGGMIVARALLAERNRLQRREEAVDHALEESFPASDPPAF